MPSKGSRCREIVVVRTLILTVRTHLKARVRQHRSPYGRMRLGRRGIERLGPVLMSVCIGLPASAKIVVLCKAPPGRQDVSISLQDRKFRDRALDCISGDFIADMTPCAPPGSFGLSAPTGSADLVAVVDRWQEYAHHIGGVAGHCITADKMAFSGGFNSPDNGYKESWTFTVNRLTGSAELTQEGKPSAVYTCAKANQRF